MSLLAESHQGTCHDENLHSGLQSFGEGRAGPTLLEKWFACHKVYYYEATIILLLPTQ